MAMDHLPEILQLGAPMPRSMGRCADLLHDIKELRLLMEKQAKEIEAREKEVKEHIINNVEKGSGDTGASGLRFRVQVIPDRKPILMPDGWGGFTSWMNKNGRFDMIQKRLSPDPILEWQKENNRIITGLEMMNVPKLSLTKI